MSHFVGMPLELARDIPTQNNFIFLIRGNKYLNVFTCLLVQDWPAAVRPGWFQFEFPLFACAGVRRHLCWVVLVTWNDEL